jgi:hypothetical protein
MGIFADASARTSALSASSGRMGRLFSCGSDRMAIRSLPPRSRRSEHCFGIARAAPRWFQGDFLVAAVIAPAIFMFGAGCVHVNDVVRRGNFAPWNSGVILYDFLVPLVLVGLLVAYRA